MRNPTHPARKRSKKGSTTSHARRAEGRATARTGVAPDRTRQYGALTFLGSFPRTGLDPRTPGAICRLVLKYGLVTLVLGSFSGLPIMASRTSISGLPLPTPGLIPVC